MEEDKNEKKRQQEETRQDHITKKGAMGWYEKERQR